nr:hypothetical protein [uncultured Desulfobulbus sp.]
MKLEDIDPDLKYCSQCGDEYRAEMETCASCGITLQWGHALLAAGAGKSAAPQAPVGIAPEEAAVSIRKGPMLQIKELQRFLQSRGLAARIAKEEGAGCGCRGPEVILQVREGDLQQVMALLAEEYWSSTGLDDHDTQFAGAVFDEREQETLCPACGYRFSTRETTCPDCGLCFG